MEGQAHHTEGLMLEEPSHDLERAQEGQELEKKIEEEPVPHVGWRDETRNVSCQRMSNAKSEVDQNERQEGPPNGPEVPIKKEELFGCHGKCFSEFS
jgi:hypothetical protein